MSELEKETFLRVLKGAPLSVLIALWVHGSMGRKDLSDCTGYDVKTVNEALAFLDELRLVNRPHYRKWAVASGFYQLPLAHLALPEKGVAPLSDERPLIVENPEKGVAPLSANSQNPEKGVAPLSANSQNPEKGVAPLSANSQNPEKGVAPLSEAEKGVAPLSAATSDLIRSDDEEEDVDNSVPFHFPTSLHLLETIGIGGSQLEKMAQYRPYEVLGAWWYLLAGGWAKNPKAVLRSHLLHHKRTPHGYLDLAKWWLESPAQHGELVTAVCAGGHVEGLTVAGLSAAGELYDARKEFGL